MDIKSTGKLIRIINRVAKFSRAGNWLPKMYSTAGLALLFLLFLPLNNYNSTLLIFLVYHAITLAYAHIINSVADLKIDVAAGKNFGVTDFPKYAVNLILGLLAMGMLIIPFFFGGVVFSVGLIVFFLITFYSAEPLRLKTKGIFGLISVSLVTAALQFLIFVIIINKQFELGFYLAGFLFLGQLVLEAMHQIDDFENDKKQDARTWAVRTGKKNAKFFLKISIMFFGLYHFVSFAFGVWKGGLIFVIVLLTSIQLIVDSLRVAVN